MKLTTKLKMMKEITSYYSPKSRLFQNYTKFKMSCSIELSNGIYIIKLPSYFDSNHEIEFVEGNYKVLSS